MTRHAAFAILLAGVASCGGKDEDAAAPAKPVVQERLEAGWLWMRAETSLRASPGAETASQAKAPAGARVPYRKVVELPEGGTWYWIEPPGRKPGWVPAGAVSSGRVTAPPAVSAAPRVKAARAGDGASSPLPGGRLDARALTDGQAKGAIVDGAASDLATLQSFVDTVFGGPSPTPQKIRLGRERDARELQKGIP